MKKTIILNAKLEIDSKYEITDEVITDILKGIDCWSDVHNIDNKLYTLAETEIKEYNLENMEKIAELELE